VLEGNVVGTLAYPVVKGPAVPARRQLPGYWFMYFLTNLVRYPAAYRAMCLLSRPR